MSKTNYTLGIWKTDGEQVWAEDSAGDRITICCLSNDTKVSYEEAEARFQSLQSVPGIEPDPMDPLRVLEDDEPIE